MFKKTFAFFKRHPYKHKKSTSTNRPILIMDKLVKITTVYGKMLTICKKFRRKVATWYALLKKWMDVHHG